MITSEADQFEWCIALGYLRYRDARHITTTSFNMAS